LHEYRNSGHWDRGQDRYATAAAAGHSVVLGSRDPGDEKLAEWLAQQPGDAQAASHAAT
jgi:hypothetical protein